MLKYVFLVSYTCQKINIQMCYGLINHLLVSVLHECILVFQIPTQKKKKKYMYLIIAFYIPNTIYTSIDYSIIALKTFYFCMRIYNNVCY